MCVVSVCSLVLILPCCGWRVTFGDGQSRAPLVSKNIETNATITIDIRVVDSSREVDLRRLEWVVRGELDLQEEDAS